MLMAFQSYASVLILVRDAYESIVLHAFFWLLLEYISHDPEEQKEVFRDIKLEKWVFPLGFIKKKPSGLYFLQIMKWGILQYAFLRPACTIVALVLNVFGLYCEDSWSPAFGQVYITVILSISVSVAMYCLIQLYVPIADHLKPYHPLLKFLAIKSVVFLTFWQSTLLAVLAMFGAVKDTEYMTAAEINIGFAALLETFEMMIFAFLHVRAFSYRPYRPSPEDSAKFTPTSKWRSLGHALDFRDVFRQMWAGCVYCWDRIRGYEPEQSGRNAHLQQALGRRRVQAFGKDRAVGQGNKGLVGGVEFAHQWIMLDLHDPKSPMEQEKPREPGLEEEIDEELRRLRMISEHNRQMTMRGSGGGGGGRKPSQLKGTKKSSTHRRYAAVSEEFEPPSASALGVGREGDMSISSFGHQRLGVGEYGPGSRNGNENWNGNSGRSFWKGLYDHLSLGVRGGSRGHRQVLHDDYDDGELVVPENPSWKNHTNLSPAGSPELDDRPPRSMVGLPTKEGPVNWSPANQYLSERPMSLTPSHFGEDGQIRVFSASRSRGVVGANVGGLQGKSVVSPPGTSSNRQIQAGNDITPSSKPTDGVLGRSPPRQKSSRSKVPPSGIVLPSPLSLSRSPVAQGGSSNQLPQKRDSRRRSGVQDDHPTRTGRDRMSVGSSTHQIVIPSTPSSDSTIKASRQRASPPSKHRSRRRSTVETSERQVSRRSLEAVGTSPAVTSRVAPRLVGGSPLSTPPRFSPPRNPPHDTWQEASRYSPDPLDSPPPSPIFRTPRN
ncbi:hypothetical protein FRB98_008242 [Tulasnella sp. 332]|nr:hypothetical protein FRB98_008242 [Tulasnella sp. 332]